jgi:hypothetical protein
MAKQTTPPVSPKAKILPRQLFIAVGLALIVAGSIYVFASYAVKLFYEAPRAARVHEVYESLKLPDDYIYQTGAIAGERRLYNQDGTRSWSSHQVYLRGASLGDTVSELNTHITEAGFKQIRQSEKTAAVAERNYVNDKQEYLRFKAESKLRLEYYQNAHLMGLDTATIEKNAIDPNTGPIRVTIKVNLDDNNE